MAAAAMKMDDDVFATAYCIACSLLPPPMKEGNKQSLQKGILIVKRYVDQIGSDGE